MGFYNCFNVNRNGMRGGLAMLQSSDMEVNIVSYNNHHIDIIVHETKMMKCRCTWVYGHPEGSQKRHTWTLPRRLTGLFSFPWLYFEDFNEILDLREKLGGRESNLSMMIEFREAVNDCNLVDLGCK